MQLTQAILPLAGLGTRFLPWTKVVPKELLPIGSKPMIALLVEECLDAGVDDICFVLSHGKELIREYFRPDPRLEKRLKLRGKDHLLDDLKRYESVRFHSVYQEEQLGDGHAILQAKEWVKSPYTAILFGDDLFVGSKTGLRQLCSGADAIPLKEWGIFFALENIPKKDTGKYGIVDIERACVENPRLKKIKGLVEKPTPKEAPSTLGIVGRYIIPKSTFDILPRIQGINKERHGEPVESMTFLQTSPIRQAQGDVCPLCSSIAQNSHDKEIRLIDAFQEQLGEIPIYGYECEGTRIDTGTPEGYRKALQILG